MFSIRTDVFGGPGGPGIYLHYFAGPGAYTNAEVTEGGARVAAFWNSLKSLVASGTNWQQQNTANEIDPTTGDITSQRSSGASTLVISTGVGDALPGATSYVLRYLTGVFTGGRQVRGRIFVGPPTENQNTVGGVPPAATITSLQTAVTLLGTQIVTPLTHVVWHRPGAVGGSPGAAVSVSSYSVATTFGYLRSHSK